MTLKWKIDEETHGKLDENLQGLYKQQDDAFVLDCEGAEGEDDIAGLRKALETEREHKRKAERQAKQFKEDNKGLSREDFDKMEAAQTEQLATIKNLQAELETTKQELSKKGDEILDGRIGTAVAQANGNLALLKPVIREKLQENPEADIAEMVESMKQDETFGSAFKATAHSGGGSLPQESSGRPEAQNAGKYPTRRSEFTDRQKVDYQNEFGLDSYMDIPA
jgi:hypothetical protein